MARKLDSASICEYHHGYCKGTDTASKPHPSTARDSAEMSPGLLSFSLTTLVILPNTCPAFQTVGPFSPLPSLSLSFSSFRIHLLGIPCMPGSRDTSTNIMHSLKLLNYSFNSKHISSACCIPDTRNKAIHYSFIQYTCIRHLLYAYHQMNDMHHSFNHLFNMHLLSTCHMPGSQDTIIH